MLLVTGRARSGKTRRVLREFREALLSKQSARLLVPTATLSEHLRNELARDGAVFRSRSVSTLARFVSEMLPDSRPVSSAHFHLMVEHAVIRLQLPAFDKVSTLAGIHSRLSETLNTLEAAGCSPRDLARVRGEIAPFRDPLVAVWKDVQAQMRAQNEQSRSEQLRLLTSRIPALDLPDRIWLDGFAQLSQLEIELVCALGARTELTLTLSDEGMAPALKAALLERGFVEDHHAGGCTSRETLLVPENTERETEEIARRILEAAQQGTPFREMGVILRQPARYEPLLRATFERFGIPAQFLFGDALSQHPVGRVLSGVIEALLSGWEHEVTIGLLRLLPGIGASDALDRLEIEVRKRLPGKGVDPLLALAHERNLQRVLRQLLGLNRWLGVRKTPEEWVTVFAQLAALLWPGVVPGSPSRDEIAQFRFQTDALRAFSAAIEEAAAWWNSASAPISLHEFWRVARTVVRLSSVQTSMGARNTVHVISAYEARQWDLSIAFVCGLVEKEFPAQHARDPFLSDAAVRDLARFGVLARTSADKDAEEAELFEAVRSRARDLTVLSYPRVDSRGQRTLPSIFLKDQVPQSRVPPVRPALPLPIAQWRAPAVIRDAELLPVLTQKHTSLSVSSLENLLQCPFQFFAGKTLRVSEMPDRPEDRLSFLVQGNIAHSVLAEWAAAGFDFDAVFQAAFQRICDEQNVVPGFRTERSKRSLELALQRFVRESKLPRPHHSETEQPFEIALSSDLSVRGRLDRVDQLEDGAWVVMDYKYSGAQNTKDKVTDETKLQGPLYAYALQQQKGRTASAMVYVGLKDETSKVFGWGEIPGVSGLLPLTPDWIPRALERVAATVSEYRSGIMHPRPLNASSCRYCDYRDACRIEQRAAAPASRA